MDAKVDDWVVTPRRGKAVEINALWYNALRLLRGWVTDVRRCAGRAGSRAPRRARVRESFNRRFWFADGGYLYDVVDGERGDDPACRPNQVLAISLDHPVLDRDAVGAGAAGGPRAAADAGRAALAGAGHPDYKPKYYGDLRSRDAAYHQGTVWALADRAVRRRVAEGAPAGQRAAPAICSTGSRAISERGVRRIDQRDLRRRSAVYVRADASRRPGASPKCCAVSKRRTRLQRSAAAGGCRRARGALTAGRWPRSASAAGRAVARHRPTRTTDVESMTDDPSPRSAGRRASRRRSRRTARRA